MSLKKTKEENKEESHVIQRRAIYKVDRFRQCCARMKDGDFHRNAKGKAVENVCLFAPSLIRWCLLTDII